MCISMDRLEILEILMQRGYSERNASLVAEEMINIASQLRHLLEGWLMDKSYCKNYEIGEYSVMRLQKERRMNYPAALLTLDWLIKEPEAALRSLNRGIK